MSNKRETSMKKVHSLLDYAIDNNIKLQEKGKRPIALCLEADAGIGKTSIVEQVAKEREMGYTKLVLSQLEETGDLIGFPIREYECQVLQRFKDENGEVKVKVLPKKVWVNEKQLDEAPGPNMKYRQTGGTRMGYAKPAWVPEYNENGTILCLDDFSRANSQLIQSTMEIILTQGYVSWTLPKKTTIILTTNPDNGNYNVTSQDEAQSGRYVQYNVKYDLDTWMNWAEKSGVDGRCINFVANFSSELFEADEDGNRICNPRSFVMFADMISGINDWDNSDNLEFIRTIADGCFRDENGRFSQMFTSFLRNKMHTLIQPKEVLTGSWANVKAKLESTLFDANGTYRPDIASILERRFANFTTVWLESDDKTPIATVKDRILDFIEYKEKTGKDMFSQDMMYHMIKTITSENKKQTGRLLYEPKIAKLIA